MSQVYSDELNREITLSIRKASVGDYTVYQNKIWRVTASIGCGKKRTKHLVREIANEDVWVSGNEPLFEIIRPSGYIRV